MCGNHFSLFCCADINEKPSFGKHTGFFLMSTDSKRNTLKKSAHTAAGIFKENTFFFFLHQSFHTQALTIYGTAGEGQWK